MHTDDGALAELLNTCPDDTLIVGIGSTLRGDDGAGPAVCRLLPGEVAAQVIDAGTAPENYIQKIRDRSPHCMLIIDAIDFGAEAGTVAAFHPNELDPAISSTHALSPRLFVDVVCRGTRTTAHLIGVQPAQTELGHAMSPEVTKAVRRVADALAARFAH